MSVSMRAEIVNISLAGMAILTPAPLEVDRRYRFRLGQSSDAVQVEGTVRRRSERRGRSADATSAWESGVAFDNVFGGLTEELLSFIERNVILDPERRLAGRFRFDGEQSVDLRMDREFFVESISLGGMLAGLERRIEPAEIEQLAGAGSQRLGVELRLGGEPFFTRARLVRWFEVPGPGRDPITKVAVEFVRTAPEQHALLADFVASELATGR